MVETRFHAPAPPTPNHLFDPECFHWKVYCRIAIFRSSVIGESTSYSRFVKQPKFTSSIRILRIAVMIISGHVGILIENI
jgi:hypothetical protein